MIYFKSVWGLRASGDVSAAWNHFMFYILVVFYVLNEVSSGFAMKLQNSLVNNKNFRFKYVHFSSR